MALPITHRIETDWHGEQIVVVAFSDPARANQICWAAVDALGEALGQCRQRGARVLILASALEGHWLEHAWLRDLSNGVEGLEQTGSGAGWFTALQELAHPDLISIAAVSGHCSGGGAELGWACDFRIAESQATFCQPEINMGLTTGIGGSSRLARLAGRATATEMVLTGEPVSAARLHALGAVNRVVAAGESVRAALELGAQLVAKPAQALAGLKRILAHSDDAPLQEALRFEQEVFQSVVPTDAARRGMQHQQSRYDSAAVDE